ncbi:flagellar basal body protein FliL [Prauserella muralis]|uniref:Flagellar basal body protein FliL n=1 Tax=Prauserella muralis TaxID=588067 RepID=A0A2V4AQN0_9PSEU|nr:flagellar basal body protein FliL [Prauserella muralis]PXY22922.1 flagellar basal body protein FliL [Prauserella muralis]TWE28058.1 hypothetical protein FHX69_0708 [Prauserella muralis]
MTQPGPGDQWPQQPGGYPPPGPPQQYPGGPQQQQPYPGPPAYGAQPGYATRPGAAAPQGPGGYGPPPGAYPVPPTPPRRSRRGLVIGLVVALVVAVGGVGTWFAFFQSDSAASGAATPNEAAMNLANALSGGDVVGLLSTLAPAEAALLTDPVAESTEELKRLGVLKPDADPKALTGLEVTTRDLRFDEQQAERVNDHLTITKLTGGTLTVSADVAAMPFTEDYLDALLDEADVEGLPQGGQSRTLDISQMVRAGGEPVRIATVQVDGEWYPSLFYSIADYGLRAEGLSWPREPLPARGADSPNAAVQQTVQAALDGDLRRVIELLPPDELAVLHDVGPVLLRAAGDPEPSGVKITSLETETSEVTGGTRATVTALELQIPGQGTVSLRKEGDCYQATIDGATERVCGDQLASMAAGQADDSIPPAARQAVANLGAGVMRQGLGVVTTEVDGAHYVSPFRTFTELGMTFLRSMQPEDLKAFLESAG